jgi:hypothetical protein
MGAHAQPFWEDMMHIVLGVAGLAVLSISRSREPLTRLAVIFGVFYTASRLMTGG